MDNNGPGCFPPGSCFLSTPWINVDYRSWALTHAAACSADRMTVCFNKGLCVCLGEGGGKKWLQHFAKARCRNGHINKYCTIHTHTHTHAHRARQESPLCNTSTHCSTVDWSQDGMWTVSEFHGGVSKGWMLLSSQLTLHMFSVQCQVHLIDLNTAHIA